MSSSSRMGGQPTPPVVTCSRFQVSLLIGHEVAHVPCEETLVGDESASSLPREVAVDLERHSLLGG